MSRWFRVYEDMVDDPKVQRLPAPLFKTLVNLWCLASSHGGALPSVSDIAFKLRMSEAAADKAIRDLIGAGLIDEFEDCYRPHNWNGRQFKSDSSTPRVKKHRNAKRNAPGSDDETLHGTPPETETDTEAETHSLRECVSPARPHLIPDDWKPQEATYNEAEAKRFAADSRAKGKKRVDWQAEWEVWKSRIADYGEAAPPKAQGPPPPPQTWIGSSDPRWSGLCERAKAERGKPLSVMTLQSKAEPGSYVPNEWLAH